MHELSLIVNPNNLKFFEQLEVIPKVEFEYVFLPGSYSEKDMKEASDLLSNLLKWDPKKRLTAE
jgi:hypothetical protein